MTNALPTWRTDGWQNFLTGVATNRDKRLYSCVAPPPIFSQSDLENLYRGNDLARRICNVPAYHMTRKGWELDVDDDNPDVKKDLETYQRKLGTRVALRRAKAAARLYGRCYVIIGVNDGSKFDKPIRFESIRDVRYLNVIDPYGLQVDEVQRDPLAPDFGKPLFYRLSASSDQSSGMRIHASRVLVFDGSTQSPYQERYGTAANSGLAFCPDSVFVAIYNVIRDYDASWDSVGVLVQDFAQAVIKIRGLAQQMAAHGEQAVRDRMAILEESRSTLRALLMDADGEDFKREPTPLTGLPDILDRWIYRVCAAAEVPATLLFGMSPGGLNSTGESDLENFYNEIQTHQEDALRPELEKLLKVILCAKDGPTQGTEPETWTVKFHPLWSLSDKEQAELRKTVADADAIYITNQVLTPAEVALSRFGGESWSMETTIDVDAHDDTDAMATELAESEHEKTLAENDAAKETAKVVAENPPDPNAEKAPPAGGKPKAKPKK